MGNTENVTIEESKKQLILDSFNKLKKEPEAQTEASKGCYPIMLHEFGNSQEKEKYFYFAKGVESLNELEKFQGKDIISQALACINNDKKNGYQNLKKEDKYEDLLQAIKKFVVYCDTHADEKNCLNGYDNKRVMAKTMIRQSHWVKNLLKYLLNSKKDNKIAYGVDKAIQYFTNPSKHIPITSEYHRRLISKYFLDEEDLIECDEKLIKYFEEILLDEDLKNLPEGNRNYLYAVIIYNCREEWEDKTFIKETKDLLDNSYNVIFTGAPGTGKTYLAQEIIGKFKKENNQEYREYEKVGFVQFHPTFDYTDFMEGLRPKSENGNIIFTREDGIFKDFCKEAVQHPEKKYLFVIDEINRGDVSKIFGELFFAMDPGYRGDKIKIKTQYQKLVEDEIFKDGFYIPKNVYIIGTMNDIDRSVESMDFAFRRRFAFKEIDVKDTQFSILKSIKDEIKQKIDIDDLIDKMDALNLELKKIGLNEAYYIGASYFKKVENFNFSNKRRVYNDLWNYHIKGVLYEYFRGDIDVDDKMKRLKDAYDLKD